MWGGFDLSATRYRGVATTPPADRPALMQHSMTEEHVAVRFSFGSPDSSEVGFYAYIAPQPDGLEGRSWGPDGALGCLVLGWRCCRGARCAPVGTTCGDHRVRRCRLRCRGQDRGIGRRSWSVPATMVGMPAEHLRPGPSPDVAASRGTGQAARRS
jgi:hypothetical protein